VNKCYPHLAGKLPAPCKKRSEIIGLFFQWCGRESVTYRRDQWLNAKVRQLSAFEGQKEISVGVAPLYERLHYKNAETP
jgi:hypothetical protein